MTRENQALTTELADTSRERDQLQRKLSELSAAIAGKDYALRALEVEKEELLETYRTVLGEKRKLEADLQAMG